MRKLLCIPSRNIYDSIEQAAKIEGIPCDQIEYSIRTGRRVQCKEFKWVTTFWLMRGGNNHN